MIVPGRNGEGNMATAAPTKTPWHLWVVGILSLLWNAFGGYDYTMTQLRDPIIENIVLKAVFMMKVEIII
jgi:hypothetical protein